MHVKRFFPYENRRMSKWNSGDAKMMSKDIVNLDSVIVDLYMMLDNIDTFSDMTTGDYEAFYTATMKEVQKREQYYNLFVDIKRGMEPAVRE